MKSNYLKAALLVSSAALALSAGPASATPPVLSGYVDAWGALGNSSYSENETYYEDGDGPYFNHNHDSENANSLGADGRANIQWDSGFGIQLDAQGSDFKVSHDSYTGQMNDLAAHFYQRSDDMLWGGFASVGSDTGTRYGTLGLEFQKYCNQWTFYAQASWSGGDRYGADSWNFNAQARYFFNPRFLLTAGIGYDTGTYSYSEDGGYYHYNGHVANWNWTLRAEYMLADLPVSIFGEYNGTYSPYHEHYDEEDYYYVGTYRGHEQSNLFMVGVRLFLNQQDLQTNDRTGASLEDFNPWTGKTSTIFGYGGGD